MRACYVFCVACVFLLKNKADKLRQTGALKCVGMNLSDLYAEVAQVGLFMGKVWWLTDRLAKVFKRSAS